MDPSSSSMEKPINHDPLKCPRCDSSNTKFCYYNNYSLSQPRHFCKACKRYWTRGGTLRTVPVGGGCRKNKRAVKRTQQPTNENAIGVFKPPQISLSPVSNQMTTSLFYNTQPTNNNLELNFPFSTFSLTGVSSGFDFQQPHMNGFGLGFSSGLEAEGQGRIQDFIDQQDRLIMGSASGSFGSTSTMTSLLASLQQPRIGYGISNGIELKTEAEKRSNEYPNNNQLVHDDQLLNRSSDANSSILWNSSNNIGPWFDPSTNSVPSLI